MLSDKFIKLTQKFWSAYLKKIQTHYNCGDIEIDNGLCILYPNILLITITDEHYIAELIGAQDEFNGLTLKKHKESSTYRYLNQFNEEILDPIFKLNSIGTGFKDLCFTQEADFEHIIKRFPTVKMFSTKLAKKGATGGAFSFGPKFGSAFIETSVLVNKHLDAFRAKYILEMIIVKKNITKNEYIELLNHITKDNRVTGVHLCNQESESNYILAGQFQNLYLLPGLRETTLGEFLNTHPEIINDAFSSQKFEYEPYLLWLEAPKENKDEAINPDFLVQRQDGFYDIYDIKTAALSKNSITKGKRNRRRFIDYVEEGVAQLANYKEYFSYKKNREYAKKRYGIVLDNPRFVLIVGNYENADLSKIDEAKRRLKEFYIIDYDTLVQMFISANQTQ